MTADSKEPSNYMNAETFAELTESLNQALQHARGERTEQPPHFASVMDAAEKVRREDRDVLRELAKGSKTHLGEDEA